MDTEAESRRLVSQLKFWMSCGKSTRTLARVIGIQFPHSCHTDVMYDSPSNSKVEGFVLVRPRHGVTLRPASAETMAEAYSKLRI
jgi:hypothetical protein